MTRSPDYLGAVGIGVSDLNRSAAFYAAALGLKAVQTFSLPHMDEIVMAHDGRTAVVLMHWTDGSSKSYADAPVKLVFYVTDPMAVMDRVIAAGGGLVLAPTAIPQLGGAVVGLAKDPDGYVIELLQAPTTVAA